MLFTVLLYKVSLFNVLRLEVMGAIVYLRLSEAELTSRLFALPAFPSFIDKQNPEKSIKQYLTSRTSQYEACANYIIDIDNMSVAQVCSELHQIAKLEKLI